MAQFRRRHMLIEAVQFQPSPVGQPLRFSETPPWLTQALGDGTITAVVRGPGQELSVKTGEGPISARPGQWIARTGDGQLVVHEPTFFAAIYEPVPATGTVTL